MNEKSQKVSEKKWYCVGSKVRPNLYNAFMQEIDKSGKTTSEIIRKLIKKWVLVQRQKRLVNQT